MRNLQTQATDDLLPILDAAQNLQTEFNQYQLQAKNNRETINDLMTLDSKAIPPELMAMVVENEQRNLFNEMRHCAAMYEDGLLLLMRYMMQIGLLSCLICF